MTFGFAYPLLPPRKKPMSESHRVDIKVGQKWKDMNPRRHRVVEVETVTKWHVTLRTIEGAGTGQDRMKKVRLDVLRTRFAFISEPVE